MPITDAQRKANNKYFSKEWSQVKLSMPNREAAELRQYCSDHGLTVAGFIRGLIHDAIESGSIPAWLPGSAGADHAQAVPGTGGGVSQGPDFPE